MKSVKFSYLFLSVTASGRAAAAAQDGLDGRGQRQGNCVVVVGIESRIKHNVDLVKLSRCVA